MSGSYQWRCYRIYKWNKILKNKSWIIEDIGRDKFRQGREEADVIYYLKLSKLKSYYRVTKRWFKQRLGLERYNYPPNFEQFLYYYSTVRSFYKKEKALLKSLEEYKDMVNWFISNKIKWVIKEKHTESKYQHFYNVS